MSLITDILSITASYIGIIAAQFFITNFLMKGAVLAYLRVRGSRGKKVLVMSDTVTDTYWTVGEIIDDALQYKKRTGKHARVVNLPRECIYSMWGVHMVHLDEAKNCAITKKGDYKTVNTFEEVDQHVERALNAPVILDKKEAVMLVLGIFSLLILIVLLFLLFSMNKKLALLISLAGGAVV